MHNLAAKAITALVPAGKGAARLRDRFGSSAPIAVEDGAASVKVAAHGYQWFGVESDT